MDNTKPIEKVPIPNVEKEIKASYVSHFNNRMVLSDQAKDALHERFLLVLEENPNTLMLFCISGNIRQQLTYLLIVPINLKLAIIVEITTLTFISMKNQLVFLLVFGRRLTSLWEKMKIVMKMKIAMKIMEKVKITQTTNYIKTRQLIKQEI